MKKSTFLLVAILFTLNLMATNSSKKIGTANNQLSSFATKKQQSLVNQEGSFYQNTNNGKIFIYFEGQWTWILDWTTYSSCFDIDEVEAKMVYGAGDPTYLSSFSFQGYLFMDYHFDYGNNVWTTNGNVYLSNNYGVGRLITSPTVFDRYSFDWQKIKRFYHGTRPYPIHSLSGAPIY